MSEKDYKVEVTIKRTILVKADTEKDLHLDDQIYEAAESKCGTTFSYDGELQVDCYKEA